MNSNDLPYATAHALRRRAAPNIGARSIMFWKMAATRLFSRRFDPFAGRIRLVRTTLRMCRSIALATTASFITIS